MAMIEGFKVRNYRALKEVTLGRLWQNQGKLKPLTPLVTVIGKNGAGKSSLFDAFGFLADCLKYGVEEACDSKGRGGFQAIRTKGSHSSIEFEIYYKEDRNSRPITYELSIDIDDYERPYVKKERLRQRRQGQKYGRPFSFLILNEGEGWVWAGNEEGIQEDDENEVDINTIEESTSTEKIELESPRKLGIATLGALKQHPRIAAFRNFIESWYLSYFTPDAARIRPNAGPQKHLNTHGDNLANVVQFMEREHPKKMNNIFQKISSRIPGILKIDTHKTEDNHLVIRFYSEGFDKPFYAQQMSDGTLKIFTYLLLLEDPDSAPFICIEEPENGLYHKLLEILASELRTHATGRKGSSQIFITTHQPYFVDALSPEEVWVLEKNRSGFSEITRASDNEIVKNMVEEGLPLGGLWYSDYFDER